MKVEETKKNSGPTLLYPPLIVQWKSYCMMGRAVCVACGP
jgi:hypothetical protein